MRPTFSIIIPCSNSINYIEKCIESIKKQTYKNYEVIIVDNSSSDGTIEKLNEINDDRFKIFNIKNNSILAKSRNLGIEKSSAEWIAFLDSDDWWTADKLEICFTYINNEIDLLYHDLEIKYNPSRSFGRKKNKSRQLKKPVLVDLLLGGNAIGNSSVVVRKKLLDEIGGINESEKIIASEDYHTWLRIAQLTDKFFYLPYRLGYYLVHNKSLSQKDMSVPMHYAVTDFKSALSQQQKIKLEANLRYVAGRFNYVNCNYKKAKKDLLFAFRNGFFFLRVRAFIMIIIILLLR